MFILSVCHAQWGDRRGVSNGIVLTGTHQKPPLIGPHAPGSLVLSRALLPHSRQPEMCQKLGEYLLQRMSRYGSAWMDRESLNTHFQETLDDLHADRLISEASCQFGSQVYIHLDVQALAEVSTQPPLSMLETPPALTPFIRECKVDIRSIRIITFSLAVPPPLHLLLGKNVLAKYSQISAFILQAKVVQVALFAVYSFLPGILPLLIAR